MFLLLLILVTTAVPFSSAAVKKRPSATDAMFLMDGANLEWPSSSTKRIYAFSGRYIPRNIIGTRVQIFRDQAFIAMPRYRPGVPFTLGTISLGNRDTYAALSPYPNWHLQEEGTCQALQSAIDLFMDQKRILWVLDVGIIDSLEEPIEHCPPKIIAIDVKTGRLSRVVDLSPLVTEHSRLQYLLADYDANGLPYLYVSDAAHRAVLVYDVTAGKGFRVVLPNIVSRGCDNVDVLYLALTKKSCGTTMLYVTYLSGRYMFSIPTELLRKGPVRGVVQNVGPKPGPLVILGTDQADIYFRRKGAKDVYVWNSHTAFKHENFYLVQRGCDYRLPTHVVSGYWRRMWVLESNFPDFIEGTLGSVGASVVLKTLHIGDVD